MPKPSFSIRLLLLAAALTAAGLLLASFLVNEPASAQGTDMCKLDAGTLSLPWEVSSMAQADCAIGDIPAQQILYFQAETSADVTITNTTPWGESWLHLKDAAGVDEDLDDLTDRIAVDESAEARLVAGQWYALMLLGSVDGQSITGMVEGETPAPDPTEHQDAPDESDETDDPADLVEVFDTSETQTAYFYPTSDTWMADDIFTSGCSPAHDCVNQPDAHDATYLALLFGGSTCLDFTVPAAALSGAVTDVSFRVRARASDAAPLQASDYGFAVFAGDDLVADVDGAPGALEGAWAELEISTDAITTDLLSDPDSAALCLDGPAGGASALQVSLVEMVVAYEPSEGEYGIAQGRSTDQGGSGFVVLAEAGLPAGYGPASAPPDVLEPTATVGNGAIEVKWDEPNDNGADITSYLVQWSSDDPNVTGAGSVTLEGNARGHVITGLENCQPYFVSVSAVNAYGTSPSGDADVVPRPRKPDPPEITLRPDGRTVWATISAPEGYGTPITGYNVLYAIGLGGHITVPNVVAGVEVQLGSSSTPFDSIFGVRAEATTALDCVKSDQIWKYGRNHQAPEPYDTPQFTSASPGNNTLTLYWDADARPIQNAQLEVLTADKNWTDNATDIVKYDTGNSRSIALTVGLTNCTSYRFRVRISHDGTTYGAWSEDFVAFPHQGARAQPVKDLLVVPQISVAATPGFKMTFADADNSADLIRYELEWTKSGSVWTEHTAQNGGRQSFDAGTAAEYSHQLNYNANGFPDFPNSFYHVRVRSVITDDASQSCRNVLSDVVDIRVPSSAGMAKPNIIEVRPKTDAVVVDAETFANFVDTGSISGRWQPRKWYLKVTKGNDSWTKTVDHQGWTSTGMEFENPDKADITKPKWNCTDLTVTVQTENADPGKSVESDSVTIYNRPHPVPSKPGPPLIQFPGAQHVRFTITQNPGESYISYTEIQIRPKGSTEDFGTVTALKKNEAWGPNQTHSVFEWSGLTAAAEYEGRYNFRARGFSGASEILDCSISEWSDVFTFPSPPSPGPVQNASFTPGPRSVVATWDPPASNGDRPVVGYVVRVYNVTTTSPLALGAKFHEWKFGAADRGATITGLGGGQTYAFHITPVTDSNIDGHDGISIVTTADNAIAVATYSGVEAPPAPRLSVDDKTLNVEWTAPDVIDQSKTITKYEVQWGEEGTDWSMTNADGAEYSVDALTGGLKATITTLGNSTLDYDTAYDVRVRAGIDETDGDDWGPWSRVTTAVTASVPGKMTVFQAIHTSADRVKLAWVAPTTNGLAITGYQVERGGTTLTGGTVASDCDYSTKIGADRTDCTDTVSTKSSYKIRAENAAGWGPWSDAVSLDPGLNPSTPGEPRFLTATPGNGSIHLTWNAPSLGWQDVGGHVIRWKIRNTDYGGADSWTEVIGGAANTSSQTQSSYTILGVAAGRYQVSVAATGKSTTSPSVSSFHFDVAVTVAATDNPPALSVPGAPAPFNAAPDIKKIVMNWGMPDNGGSPLTGYTVQWKTSASAWSSDSSEDIPQGGDATAYGLFDLPGDTSYDVRVRASNGVGNSPWAEATGLLVLETAVVPGAPDAPTLTASTVLNLSKIVVAWSPPLFTGGADIIDYDVQYRKVGEEFWTWTEDTTNSTDTTATISSLLKSTEYEVQVRAQNSVGEGPWSASATALVPGPPAVPQNISLSASDQSLTVSWSAPAHDGTSAITGYDVRRRKTSETDWTTSSDLNPAASSLIISNLENHKEYEVQVRAANDYGDGPWSASVLGVAGVPTEPGAPNAPTLTPGDLQIVVEWSAPPASGGSPITDYDLRYKRTRDPAWTVRNENVDSTDTSYTITGVLSKHEYEVQVRAENAIGEGPWSASATATPTGPVVGAPGKPSTPRVTASQTTYVLKVTWSAAGAGNSPIIDYTLQWREAGSQWPGLADYETVRVGGSERGFNIGSLKPGTVYEVRLRARNDIDIGPWSDSASGTTMTDEKIVENDPDVEIEVWAWLDHATIEQIASDNSAKSITVTGEIHDQDRDARGLVSQRIWDEGRGVYQPALLTFDKVLAIVDGSYTYYDLEVGKEYCVTARYTWADGNSAFSADGVAHHDKCVTAVLGRTELTLGVP